MMLKNDVVEFCRKENISVKEFAEFVKIDYYLLKKYLLGLIMPSNEVMIRIYKCIKM